MHAISSIPLLALALTAPSHAYQYVASVNYLNQAIDFDTNLRQDRDVSDLQLASTFYFQEVNDTQGPLDLASYISRVSSVAVAGRRGELEFERVSLDRQGFSISGMHHFGKSGWLAGAGISRSTVESTVDTDYQTVRFHAGKYIGEYTRVLGSYSVSNTENQLQDEDDVQFSLSLAHLQFVGEASFYDLGASVSHTDADDGDNSFGLGLSATYYPTRNAGIGISYGHSFGEFTDYSTYQIDAEWYFSEKFSAQIGYQFSTFDNSGVDVNEIVIDEPDRAPVAGVPDGDSQRYNLGVKFRF